MLLTNSQELIELCEKKKTKQEFASNLQAFQSKHKQITDIVNIIQPIVEALRAFRTKGIVDIDLSQKVNVLLTSITDAQAKFHEKPDSIIDLKVNSLKSSVESLKKALEGQLSQAWEIYLDKYMPSTNNDMLAILAQVETFKQTVTQIRALDKEIKAVNYPRNNDEFDKYERKIEQLKLCWDGLQSDEVPEAVLQLLKDAANQGASLSLLTPEVQNWIDKHNISNSLKIRLT